MQTSPDSDINYQSGTLTEGQKLAGCYVLKKNLSSPECGTIWLAQDEVLGKDVSLHFIPPTVLKDARALAELRQEVKRNRQLIHPNILRVYDLVEDGSFAAVSMDCFDANSLATMLHAIERFELEDVQNWLVQVAETLSDAHRIQLIHRDLSPSNIYLRSDGGVLVANFGISRAVRDALERAGMVKGADAHLSYTSPQQIDGEKPVSTDDVYGMGALIFELLTGHPVFAGDDIVTQIRRGVPPTLADSRGGAEVPEALEGIVASCLAKTVEQRPKSCGEVASLLGQIKAGASSPLKTSPSQPASEFRESVVEQPATTPAHTTQSDAKEVENVTSSSVKSTLPPLPPASPAKKAPQTLSSSFPDLDRPRSKAPVVLVVLAAAALGIGMYVRNSKEDAEPADNAAVVEEGATQPAAVTKPIEKPTEQVAPDAVVAVTPDTQPNTVASVKPVKPGIIGVDPVKPEVVKPEPVKPEAVKHEPVKPEPVKPEPVKPVKPVDVKPVPQQPVDVAVALTLPTTPAPLPKLAIPAGATAAQIEQLLAERQAAADKQREAAEAAEAIHQKASALRETRQSENDLIKKALEESRKILTPVIAQAATLDAEHKRLEEAAQKAKAAALEAIKASEAAEKVFAEHTASSAEKLTARQKADAELRDLAQRAAERAKALDEVSKQVTQADSLRQQMQLAMRQTEQDKAVLTAAFTKAKAAEELAIAKAKAIEEAALAKAKAAEEAALAKAKAAEEAALAKAKAAAEEEARKVAREQITKLEEQVKPLDAQAMKFKTALASLAELGEAGVEPSKQIQAKLEAVNAQAAEIRAQINKLGTPGNVTVPNVPKHPTPTPAPVIKAAVTEPKLPVEPTPPVEPVAATEAGLNSIGMKFAAVGDVQFSVYPTTRKDFEAFAKATSLKSKAWQSPSFPQGPEHPVVNVTWREADAFCKWLTDKERKAGQLKANEFYRLPTDLEWSKALGLPAETGKTPEERDMDVPDVYPWGTQWPPPSGAGNFAGEETRSETPIEGYNDGFPHTSPVGKFKPTATGIYDMSGNVWQWLADDWNAERTNKTLRGSSWYNGALALSLLSSCRIGSSPDKPNDTYGFRVVKAAEVVKGKR